jgi:hypothetical protein
MGLLKTFTAITCAATLATANAQGVNPAQLSPVARDFYETLVLLMYRNEVLRVPLEKVTRQDYPDFRPVYEAEFQAHRVQLADLRGRLGSYSETKGMLPEEVCRHELSVYFSTSTRNDLISKHDELVGNGQLPGPEIRDMQAYLYAQGTQQAQLWVLKNRCEL